MIYIKNIKGKNIQIIEKPSEAKSFEKEASNRSLRGNILGLSLLVFFWGLIVFGANLIFLYYDKFSTALLGFSIFFYVITVLLILRLNNKIKEKSLIDIIKFLTNKILK